MMTQVNSSSRDKGREKRGPQTQGNVIKTDMLALSEVAEWCQQEAEIAGTASKRSTTPG